MAYKGTLEWLCSRARSLKQDLWFFEAAETEASGTMDEVVDLVVMA